MTEEKNTQPQEQTQQPQAAAPKDQTKVWAMFCHLSALAGFIGIPFGNILGPLVIWLIKKDTMPIVAEEGKASLNFQLSATLYLLVSALLIFIVIGFFLLWGIIIADVVLVIIAAVKTNNGEKFTYPCTINFIK